MTRSFFSLFFSPIFLLIPFTARGQDVIELKLDLRDAPRKILHAHLTIPCAPGPLTLTYPQWIPGEHSPTGPIDNLAGLKLTAGGASLDWRRDEVNMFAFRLTVPPGVRQIEADLDFLATAAPSGFSAGASTSPNLALVSWNEVAFSPAGPPSSQILFKPSVTLPDDWKFASALPLVATEGRQIRFASVSLETLVDSPLLAGRFFREIPLAPEITPKHFLDLAADGPEDLKVSSEQIEHWSDLIRESGALFRFRHYRSYHFLVTLSDEVAHFGLEHHESSDDRVEARGLIDDDSALTDGDLLSHEFTHSWNGKFRRPQGLATSDYSQPMKGELLWVYEGLTQYLGDVLATRSGTWTTSQFLGALAHVAAFMDHRPGRTWRDLSDTAVAAQTLYSASDSWDNWRRGVDYYGEGALIWLEADVTIRKLSKGKRSLDDFCASFLGAGGNTPPTVVLYKLEDVVASLNKVQPFDWSGFFETRIHSKSPHAPLGGITEGGYRLDYTATANEFTKATESRGRSVNAWYSLGFVESDNTLDDVLIDSPAYAAGLGPGMRIVAVNGRKASDDLLRTAIRDAQGNGAAPELIIEQAGFFKTVRIAYHGGEKYPSLAKQADKPILDEIVRPLTRHEGGVKAASMLPVRQQKIANSHKT